MKKLLCFLLLGGFCLPTHGFISNASGGHPLTTKGDLFTFSTTKARLGVGSNNQCLVADSAEVTGIKWASCSSGTGDVVGPAGSVTDNALPRFDGTTGEILQGSAVIVDDSNNMSGVGTLGCGVITQSGTTLANTYVALGASTDNRLVRRDGTAGQIQGSGITVDDSDNVSGMGTLGVGVITQSGATLAATYVALAAADDNDLIRADGTGGQVQGSGITIDDSNNVTGMGTLASGAITSGGVAVPTISSSSTLTNKTIDSDDNSISDLNTADIKAGDNLLKRDYCAHIRTGANETVFLVLDASEPFSANSVSWDLTSGSITMAVQNDGVSLTSCSAISVTTTETETDCTDTVVAADEDLTLVFSSNSSAVDIRVCVHGVKT